MACCEEEVHVCDEEGGNVNMNQIEVIVKVKSWLKRCVCVLPASL
jgi:hypothetical protein